MSYHRVVIQGKSQTNTIRLADTQVVFQLRCWAKAHLVKTGDLDLIDAVNELQQAAIAGGLVARLGQDAVQAIMATEFFKLKPSVSAEIVAIPIRKLAAATPDPNDDYATLSHSFARLCRAADAAHAQRVRVDAKPTLRVAESTQQAADYLLQVGDPERLRAWLAGHTASERAAIRQYLKQKRAKSCR